jgi:hypothetical protein
MNGKAFHDSLVKMLEDELTALKDEYNPDVRGGLRMRMRLILDVMDRLEIHLKNKEG